MAYNINIDLCAISQLMKIAERNVLRNITLHEKVKYTNDYN